MKTRRIFQSAVLGALLVSGVHEAFAASASDVTDDHIAGRVEGALNYNNYLGGYNLDVAVKERQARLDGVVATPAEKQLAERIAASTPGVKSVDNNIKVDSARAFEVPADSVVRSLEDWTTSTAVAIKLAANRRTAGSDITVETKAGEVTLNGSAETDIASKAAEQIAENTFGVKDVKNNLRISNPKGITDKVSNAAKDVGEAVSDAWVSTKVRSSLILNSDFPGSNVDTTTANGVVTLNGRVRSDFQRRKIEETVREIVGVKDVNNNLKVKSVS